MLKSKLSSKKILPKLILTIVAIIALEIVLLVTPHQKPNSVSTDAAEAYKICLNSTSKEQCYAKFFYTLTKKNPISYSVSVLEKLQDIDPKNALGCHFISHKISQAETEKDPSKWESIFKKIRIDSCTGGFIHGIIEAHLATDPKFVLNKDTINHICVEIINDKSFGERSCHHIMGHLMLFEFEGDENKAVTACKTLPLYIPQYECLSGVFMENLTREYLIAHGVDKRLDWNLENSKKIEELCQTFDGLAQKACWKEISYMYFHIYKTVPKDVFAACNRAPNEDIATECFLYGAGNMIASPQFDHKNLPSVCSVFGQGDERYLLCTRQVLGSLLYTSIKNLDDAIYMCSEIDSSAQSFCFSSIIEILRTNKVANSYIQTVCQKAPKDFINNFCQT